MSAGAPAAFNLVDSSGWIELFTAGANGPVFKPVIEKTEQLLVPTIALFEVHRVLSRSLPPELVDSCLDAMRLARVLDLTEHQAMAYGRAFPEFWIQRPHDGGAAQTANGVHVAFLAESTAQVHAFHAAALAHGCFVRDLDGHKIEAMFWNPDA